MFADGWLTGFDTGLVFCRRTDFEALGGYDESRLIAEDLDFLTRLRRLARGRGQRMVRLRGVKAITSTRKFDAHGDWFFFTGIPGFCGARFAIQAQSGRLLSATGTKDVNRERVHRAARNAPRWFADR